MIEALQPATAPTRTNAHRRRHLLAAAAVVAATGWLTACGGGGGDPDLAVDLNGTWGSETDNRYVFVLSQNGRTVTGTLRVGSFGSRTSHTLTGSVDGDRFTFTATNGCATYSSAASGVFVVQRTQNADTLEGKMDLKSCNASGAVFAPIDLFSQRQRT